MIYEQRDFWRTWLAWYLDGCPEPRTWYLMRRMAENVGRFARIIGTALLPSIERATAAVNAFAIAYRSLPQPDPETSPRAR